MEKFNITFNIAIEDGKVEDAEKFSSLVMERLKNMSNLTERKSECNLDCKCQFYCCAKRFDTCENQCVMCIK